MNGAVQGEAIDHRQHAGEESRRPADGARLRRADEAGAREPNSNTPARLRPISVNSAASAATTAGDCSWKPQPSCAPAARSASISAAQRQEATAITPPV